MGHLCRSELHKCPGGEWLQSGALIAASVDYQFGNQMLGLNQLKYLCNISSLSS